MVALVFCATLNLALLGVAVVLTQAFFRSDTVGQRSELGYFASLEILRDDAAFVVTAEQVVRRARETGTDIVVRRDMPSSPENGNRSARSGLNGQYNR